MSGLNPVLDDQELFRALKEHLEINVACVTLSNGKKGVRVRLLWDGQTIDYDDDQIEF